MKHASFEIEGKTLFSQSRIWQLNREYYENKGISAWSDEVVPSNLTSNSKVGKIYAELIFGLLKDLSLKGNTTETVYILELGAGHGKLAFHILKHLQHITNISNEVIPPFCYVLSDIVESNLVFFEKHPQLREFYQSGSLDVCYFDGIKGDTLHLRHSGITITSQDLHQPIIALANYFFDSIPNELFAFNQKEISSCSISLRSSKDPKDLDIVGLIDNIEADYHKTALVSPFYDDPILNEILEDYKKLVSNTHMFFPERGISCIKNLRDLSSKGLMLISMDKGYHEIHNLKNKKIPEIITHGSFSLWVNYHALGMYCDKLGGKALFASFSNFHLEMGCLMFLPDAETYVKTNEAYQRNVNDFGPDDLNSLKRLAYLNVARLNAQDLIALFRLNAYDSSFFIKLLPRLKQVSRSLTFNERRRLAQTMHQVWDKYFYINENFDLPYELGGLFYDLGFYKDALEYFDFSAVMFGRKADIYYNQILCYYQMREDIHFYTTLNQAKAAFPNYPMFANLERLDMS